jgi:hypothetical protein
MVTSHGGRRTGGPTWDIDEEEGQERVVTGDRSSVDRSAAVSRPGAVSPGDRRIPIRLRRTSVSLSQVNPGAGLRRHGDLRRPAAEGQCRRSRQSGYEPAARAMAVGQVC